MEILIMTLNTSLWKPSKMVDKNRNSYNQWIDGQIFASCLSQINNKYSQKTCPTPYHITPPLFTNHFELTTNSESCNWYSTPHFVQLYGLNCTTTNEILQYRTKLKNEMKTSSFFTSICTCVEGLCDHTKQFTRGDHRVDKS